MTTSANSPRSQPHPTSRNGPAAVRTAALLPRLAGVGFVAALGWWLWAQPGAERALTPAENAARLESFQQASPLQVEAVAPQQRQEALQTMQLPADQQIALEREKVELIWLTLWDDVDEDGDTVEVESAGFRQQVYLKNAPIRIAVPKPRNGIITLHGVADGGGGITVALTTATGRVNLPRLSIGQAFPMPVR